MKNKQGLHNEEDNVQDRYGLTRAVLSGRKTMTRRIIKFSDIDAKYVYEQKIPIGGRIERELVNAYSRYKVGEVVAVAQSYASIMDELENPKNFCCMGHWESAAPQRAHYCGYLHHPGMTNKMFVSANEMPHRISFTNCWAERLQDISDEDCIKEGVELNNRQYEYDGQKFYCVRGLGYWRGIGCDNFNTPREAYAALIDRISGKGTWESNPFVFAYDFELIK